MILCAGECLIDMLPRQIDCAPALLPTPGGAVMNTAIGLGRLGVDVSFLSGISTDQFGRLIEAHLEASNVDLQFAHKSDRPTTLAFVDFSTGTVTYDFYDENTAGRCLSTTDLPELPDAVDALFLGGISLINEPAAEAYAQLASAYPQKLLMLDPNIRPSFIKDQAAYRDRLNRLLAHSDIVKTSDEDLEWLFPDAHDTKEGIAALLSLGPSIVLFTEGAKGATAWRKTGGTVFVSAPKTTVVDTVGAGDTFNAGFLAGLSDQNLLSPKASANISDTQLETALDLAVRAAAYSVSQQGAQPPRREQL
ncbi:carbohydrate kinase family protein [Cognatishimia maritima]|uniref:Fructokinase n=1 Tax=Cognatishimia maritima TaxID=870908 RepID=A0A1M5PNS4_9RHOB|nr:carbohydrate kinase [Cognatishimia maritima]SHH03360.1 fructokinase [Cognatishimia maritima]